MNSFYDQDELEKIGFKSIGKNVAISRKCSIYMPDKIEIGDNTRVDDFCILSGKIKIGSFVHISAFCGLFAGDIGIILNDFSSISSKSCLYAVSDDYSGGFLANPMVPEHFKNIISKRINISKHVIIGSGCTILPGVNLSEGVAVGSMSLVKQSIEPWNMVAGVPAKFIKMRDNSLLAKEKEFLKSLNGKQDCN